MLSTMCIQTQRTYIDVYGSQSDKKIISGGVEIIQAVLALPLRIIQRNISTLQAAGEWIEYDTKKRGWYLQNGVSILFSDHLRETDKK